MDLLAVKPITPWFDTSAVFSPTRQHNTRPCENDLLGLRSRDPVGLSSVISDFKCYEGWISGCYVDCRQWFCTRVVLLHVSRIQVFVSTLFRVEDTPVTLLWILDISHAMKRGFLGYLRQLPVARHQCCVSTPQHRENVLVRKFLKVQTGSSYQWRLRALLHVSVSMLSSDYCLHCVCVFILMCRQLCLLSPDTRHLALTLHGLQFNIATDPPSRSQAASAAPRHEVTIHEFSPLARSQRLS
ncbi:hypothetical protein BaRGS_00007817, partial [Batillaria attramentaria]